MGFDKNDALKDYVEVHVRIERFWQRFPNGRIQTEIQFHPTEQSTVIVRADIYRDLADTMPAATGHAYEKEGSSFINRTSYIENCETSAVGRALAIMGFEIKKSIASKEEVANAILQQEQKTAPKMEPATEKQQEPSETKDNGTFPTEGQIKLIFAKLSKSGYTKTDGELIKKVISELLGYTIAQLTDIKRTDINKVAEFLSNHKKGE